MALFDRVLVANRGEIALRIMATLRELGIASVAVYTEVDRDALHVRRADQAIGLGSTGGSGGYLDTERIVAAAVSTGSEAVHPGYGFLSENPVLARACAAAGVVFVGPPAAAIELMGDKINAKRTVAAAGVAVVPGRDEAGLDDAELAAAALEIGLPVLLKPSAGGGGKGMRLVTAIAELPSSIAAARREALGAFGDATLLVERFVTRPRHVEMQIFADGHGAVVALGERECSLQRRHQKIVEEAPSPLLDTVTREAMADSAVAVARSCGYVGAGTVEFILSADRPRDYFFMEMNTRLQVEHPVTEMVLGVDLVEWQLRVAAGERLPWDDRHPVPLPRGHAVEARVYAEDPRRGFLPSSGRVLGLRQPATGRHVRVDSALEEGAEVATHYDPLLAKVIAWGPDRSQALARLRAALSSTAILGVATNTGFLTRLLGHPDVVAGDLDTGLVERVAADLNPDRVPSRVIAAAALLQAELAVAAGPVVDPWTIRDSWRPGGPGAWTTKWRTADRLANASIRAEAVSVDGEGAVPARARMVGADQLMVEMAGDTSVYAWATQGDEVWLGHGGDSWKLTAEAETIDATGPAMAGDGQVTSPMPGTVVAVHVQPGDTVEAGRALVSVEAMKMEHVVRAGLAGQVSQILVHPGEAVKIDQALVIVDPAGVESRPES